MLATLVDPTRTNLLRRKMLAFGRAQLRKLQQELRKLIIDVDGLGLNKSNLLGNAGHQYASTQINVADRDVLRGVGKVQAGLDKADILELESKPHITIRYGLHEEADTPTKVASLVADSGMLLVTIGRLSLFEQPYQDVLKYEVNGRVLHDLHRRLGLLPNTSSYPRYSPHMTVAYLKPGTGAKYLYDLGHLYGTELRVTEIVYSSRDRVQTLITINSKGKVSVDEIVMNVISWGHLSPADRLKEFASWLRQYSLEGIMGLYGQVWQEFCTRMYRAGAARAWIDSRRMRRLVKDESGMEQQAHLRRLVYLPASRDGMEVLKQQVVIEVTSMVDWMVVQLSRLVASASISTEPAPILPRELYRGVVKVLGQVEDRLQTIINTEGSRAFVIGQLDSMELLGVRTLKVLVERTPNGVCPRCQVLASKEYTPAQVRGLLPVHPNCKCALTPVK